MARPITDAWMPPLPTVQGDAYATLFALYTAAFARSVQTGKMATQKTCPVVRRQAKVLLAPLAAELERLRGLLHTVHHATLRMNAALAIVAGK